MKLKSLLTKLVLPSLILGLLPIAPARAATTITAASCNQADVQSAINQAASEDTVRVPVGTCTWNGDLTITKGIILEGVGVGQTNITGNVGNSKFLITYQPQNPAANEPFRLTGFTFDLNNNSRALKLKNNTTLYALNKIRIDHNSFLNNISTPSMEINGPIYGVLDNNMLTGSVHIDNYGQNTCGDWSDQEFSYGSANNFFFEDNNIISNFTATTGGHGGRYVWRYNTFRYTGSTALAPWFDMHGNQPSGVIGPRGGEIYGNLITSQENKSITIFGHRGGKMLAFNNQIGSGFLSASAYTREEYGDEISCNGLYTMHVNDSYYWNNRFNNSIINSSHIWGTGIATGGGNNYIEDSRAHFNFCVSGCYAYGVKIVSGTGAGQYRNVSTFLPPTSTKITISNDWSINPDSTSQYQVVNDSSNVLEENEDYYNQNISFDGTAGLGVGTISARPTTCNTGVGYWATEQSTTVLDSMVGVKPTSPITGTFFKCTSPNVWGLFYTPYTYPHPLVSAATATPLTGDINSDHIVNSIDWSIMNPKWLTSDSSSDLNKDGIVNSLDYSILNGNWFKTW